MLSVWRLKREGAGPVPMPGYTIDVEAVVRRHWTLRRVGGAVLAPRLRLGFGGHVLIHHNPNEARWRLHEGCLELLDQHGRTTTRFDHVGTDAAGHYRLEGAFVGPGAQGVRHVLSELAGPVATEAAAPRIAVLVRTHMVSEKLWQILDRLADGIGYDLYVCADQTRGALKLGGARVLAHSTRMCGKLGLLEEIPGNLLLWYFGDYAFYCAYSDIPNYDYYVLVEYDVDFTRPNTLFLEGLLARVARAANGPFDLVATQFGTRPPEWGWGETCAGRFDEVHGVLFPFVVLSRRALEYLFDWRRYEAANPLPNGTFVFCEAFVPTALIVSGGFSCCDVNTLIPGAWEPSTFRVGKPMLLDHPPVLPRGIEIIHPVFSEAEYLARAFDDATREGRMQEFASSLAPDGGLTVSTAAAMKYRARASEFLSLAQGAV